jgi:hypothetical protein
MQLPRNLKLALIATEKGHISAHNADSSGYA